LDDVRAIMPDRCGDATTRYFPGVRMLDMAGYDAEPEPEPEPEPERQVLDPNHSRSPRVAIELVEMAYRGAGVSGNNLYFLRLLRSCSARTETGSTDPARTHALDSTMARTMLDIARRCFWLAARLLLIVVRMLEAFLLLISGKVASFPRNSGTFFRCYAITGKSGFKALVSGVKIPLKIQHNSGRKKRIDRTAAWPASRRSLAGLGRLMSVSRSAKLNQPHLPKHG